LKKVISDTKAPIKIWTNDLEPEAEKQVRNVADLPFIYSHVAVMPDAHAGKGSTIGTVIATKGAIIPSCVGVDIGCFSGETKVPLLDGTQKTLKQLYEAKESFWVYSLDKNRNLVPGKATCIQTRKEASLLKITVSGGEEIICTPDHRFMLNNGSYKEAKDLVLNESLMPFYRKWQTRDGYESVNNGKKTSKLTHRMVWEYLNGKIPTGYIVHHINHKNFDNRPENLMLMTAQAHSRHHRKNGHSFRNEDSEFQKKRIAGIKKHFSKEENKKRAAKIGTENIKSYMKNNSEHFKNSVANNGKRGAKYLKTFNTTPRKCKQCDFVGKNPATLTHHVKNEHGFNHKVISIEFLDKKEDVYCLNVPEHSNFALSAGVFVHNCGMVAVKLPFKIDLFSNLSVLRHSIERSIPTGHHQHNDGKDLSSIGNIPSNIEGLYNKAAKQLGTLGGGNHFIEICGDQNNDAWLMIHSGSRYVGKDLAERHINKAKAIMKQYFISTPDPDLAYLVDGTPEFSAYIADLLWAQKYAALNRETMVELALEQIYRHLFSDWQDRLVKDKETFFKVNCHHNYTAKENFGGNNVWVTRKGAVSAREGQFGIIPGSMGTKSYIVQGKGNEESFCSCSHGAGRRMSRTKARQQFTIEDLKAQTLGIESRKDSDIIDEIPAAYKDIDTVMDNQSDLVTAIYTLKQILCIKGD